jgi:hypothetical protein
MPTTARATLDRILDDEHAVLLVEDEDGVADEIVLDVAQVPEAGRVEGAVFAVTVTDAELTDLEYLDGETEERRGEAQDRLDRLSSPLGEGTNGDESVDGE